MRNAITSGTQFQAIAPYAVAGGGGCLIGAALFGVAIRDTPLGDLADFEGRGVWDLPKVAAGAIAAGAKLYWDDAAKNLTTTAGALRWVATATIAAADGATIVRARLNGVAI